MRGFGLERSWRTGGTGNTQYNTSGTFVVPFGKQFTQISGAGAPGPAASYYAGYYEPPAFLYIYVTAFYDDPTPYAAFADGNSYGCPPTSYYSSPGASTTWTCSPVYGPSYYDPPSYYAGATGPTNTILGVTFPGGTAGNPGAYVNPTTIDTNYTYVYPNSYAIPNLSGGYVIISVK
jgi:hypothetical protein